MPCYARANRYTTSTVRRVATESLLPLVLEWLAAKTASAPSTTVDTSTTVTARHGGSPQDGEVSSGAAAAAPVAPVAGTPQTTAAASPPLRHNRLVPWSLEEQRLRQLYDPFDDYLEMVGAAGRGGGGAPLVAAV